VTNFLLLLLFGSFWIWGIYAPFSEGYVFEKVGTFFTKLLGKQIVKPLFACPVCMPSVHGSILAVVVYDFTFIALAFVICLCGLNFIIKSILFPEYE
jgi:hypothetical protein